jgi:DNA polymerase-1
MLQEDIYLVSPREEYFRGIGWDKFLSSHDALAMLEFIPSMQVDLETTGNSTFLKEKINSIQLGLPGKQIIFDVEGGFPISVLKRPLEEKLLYFQFGYFDLPYIYNQGVYPKAIFDTFVAESVLTMGVDLPRGSRGLGNLANKYLGVTLDKDLQKDIASGLTSVERIIYAGRDVIYLEAIADAQRALANQFGVHKRVDMECAFTLVMAYLEYSGAYIDMEFLYEFVRNSEFEEWKAYNDLRDKYGKINWNSPQQVAPFLEQHGIKEINEKTGNHKTGEEVLVKYPDIPIAVDLLKYREYSKQTSTYGRNWFGYVQDNGRIHTRFKQLVTTGRMSSGDSGGRTDKKPWKASYKTKKPFPNFQNIPAKTMRGIVAADKNNVLIQCDYPSQESVLLADQSGDPTLLNFFKNDGGDIYCFIAQMAYPELKDLTHQEIKEQHPDIRQICKAPALAIPYGGDEYTIARNLNCPVSEAKEHYDMYFRLFKTLPEYFDKCYRYSKSKGYTPADPILGGKVFLKNGKQFREKANDSKYWKRYWDERDRGTQWYKNESATLGWYFAIDKDLKRAAVNYRIQGSGAVMTKLAGIYMYKYIQANKLHGKVRIINIVHDEILLECPKKIGEKTAKVLQAAMEKAGNECLSNITIHPKAEIITRWKK